MMTSDMITLIAIFLVIVLAAVVLAVFVIRDQRLRSVEDDLLQDLEAEGDAIEKRLIISAAGIYIETVYEDGEVIRMPMEFGPREEEDDGTVEAGTMPESQAGG